MAVAPDEGLEPTPYTDEIVTDTYHWMVRWGLISSTACTADLVHNRLPATATASAAD
jgi:hypothetical protein